ncbi:MAG: hydroxymyristoyl-ACP dehydratase [Rubrivivax sp.]
MNEISAPTGAQPATLDHAGIAARIPHHGNMCLLHSLVAWSAEHIHCTALSHQDPANPLRQGGQLQAPVALEYASQAMALHGGLSAAPGTPPQPGFLAAARSVVLHVADLATVPGALQVHATRQAGDDRQAVYQFSLQNEAGQVLVSGRATVVLNTPLQAQGA